MAGGRRIVALFIAWNGLDAVHLLTVPTYAALAGVLPVLVAILLVRALARGSDEPPGRIGSIVGGVLDGLSHTPAGHPG